MEQTITIEAKDDKIKFDNLSGDMNKVNALRVLSQLYKSQYLMLKLKEQCNLERYNVEDKREELIENIRFDVDRDYIIYRDLNDDIESMGDFDLEEGLEFLLAAFDRVGDQLLINKLFEDLNFAETITEIDTEFPFKAYGVIYIFEANVSSSDMKYVMSTGNPETGVVLLEKFIEDCNQKLNFDVMSEIFGMNHLFRDSGFSGRIMMDFSYFEPVIKLDHVTLPMLERTVKRLKEELEREMDIERVRNIVFGNNLPGEVIDK